MHYFFAQQPKKAPSSGPAQLERRLPAVLGDSLRCFCRKNDWIFIHPNYRGKFNDSGATASEKAVRDILDALEYAREHAPVDNDRIYLAGFSRGAMCWQPLEINWWHFNAFPRDYPPELFNY